MFYNRAGHHTKHWDETFSSHDYYTFSPTPVCDVSIKIDDELCGLLSSVQRLLGLLEGYCRHIDNIDNIVNLMIKKEPAASCKIDDEIRFSYFDLFIPPKYRTDKMKPILNYMDALDFGIGELERIRLTNKVIFSTHKILMDHKRDTEIIGGVREKQTMIGKYLVSVSGMETYNPPEPGEVNACMMDIQRFIRREDTIDLLIKAALLHYQIEAIHPFESGNGKIGRILILMYMFEKKILRNMLLPVSEFLGTHKVEYFDRLRAVHNHGHYEQWIKFFLRMLAITADICMLRIENLLQQRKDNIAKLAANGKDGAYLLHAYWYAEEHLFLDVNALAEEMKVSYNTAARVVRSFVDLSILKLLKEKARNRVYFYADFFDGAMGYRK